MSSLGQIDMAHQNAYEKIPPGAGAYALSAAIISFSLGYLAGQGRAIGLFGGGGGGGSASRTIATTIASEKSSAGGRRSTDTDDDLSSDGSASASGDDDASDLGELQSFPGNTEECKLVLVVRSDLGMTKGE